ncbi:hypothetical protein Tco_0190366 [Tanacetum coccineum]
MLYTEGSQKKLVRSRDVEFDEDQTLKDVKKTEKETIPQHNDDPIDLDPVPPKHFDAQFGDDIQNDEEQNDEEHGADDVDAQEQPNLDEDVHPELPVPMPPFVRLGGPLDIIILSHAYSAKDMYLLTEWESPWELFHGVNKITKSVWPLSTTEADYVHATKACKESKCVLKRILARTLVSSQQRAADAKNITNDIAEIVHGNQEYNTTGVGMQM